MNKYTRYIIITLLTPLVLFLVVALMLYLPPIQNFMVDKAAVIASEKTGLAISVNHVRLVFPCNLGVEGVEVLQQNDSIVQQKDTVARAKKIVVEMELLPLLHHQVQLNELSLHDFAFNTTNFIPEARVQGRAKRLYVRSRGIDLSGEKVTVNSAILQNARVKVEVSDTVPPDTSKTKNYWKIWVNALSVENTAIDVSLHKDTFNIQTHIDKAVATKGYFNLGRGLYAIKTFDSSLKSLLYNNKFVTPTKGLDANHLAFSRLSLGVSNLLFCAPILRLNVNQMALQEKSGLAITNMQGKVFMDSTSLHLSSLLLQTESSKVALNLAMNFNALAKDNPGKIKAVVDVSIGKKDLFFMDMNLSKQFINAFPSAPLNIKGDIEGNMKSVSISKLQVSLPSAFQLNVHGSIANMMKPSVLESNISVKAHTQNLSFVKYLLPSSLKKEVRIPLGISLNANVKTKGKRYEANFKVAEGKGNLVGKLFFDAKRMSYNALLDARSMAFGHFIAHKNLSPFSGNVKIQGSGTDVFSPKMQLTAQANIRHFSYGKYRLHGLSAKAIIKNGKANAMINSKHEWLKGLIGVELLINKHKIDGRLWCDLISANLYKLGLLSQPATLSLKGSVDLLTDLQYNYRAIGRLDKIVLNDSAKQYQPNDVSFDAITRRDSTFASLDCGDFHLKIDAQGGYKRLMMQGNKLADVLLKQVAHKHLDQQKLQKILPIARLTINSGSNNVFMKVLKRYGYEVGKLNVDFQSDPYNGIKANALAQKLTLNSIKIDTIKFKLFSDSTRINYFAQVQNNKKNPQYTFNALLNGYIRGNEMSIGAKMFDAKNKLGVQLSALAEMRANSFNAKLIGDSTIIGYELFKVNENNYVYLSKSGRVYGDVSLLSDKGTGIHFYTNDNEPSFQQDMTIGLQKFDMEPILATIPYLPKMKGVFSGDVHITQKNNEFAMSSAVNVENMEYENNAMGNLSTELVYIPLSDGSHTMSGQLMKDGAEVATVEGTFNPNKKDALDVRMVLNHTPMDMVNGFIPDKLMGLKGYADGEIGIKGTSEKPIVNGEVFLDSAYLESVPYGIELKMDDDPVRIVNSRLLLENFNLYSHNDEPLLCHGYFDFSNLDRMTMDVQLRANNYLLIDAQESSNSTTFGKAFVNFAGRVSGPLDGIKMRGKLDVLGSTNMTYVMLDSPLNNDNRFEGLVKFVDFREKVHQVVKKPTVNGLDIDLAVSIDNGANIRCDLNTNHSNYLALVGGGDLRMRYNNIDNVVMSGRYTINSGTMKYSLPVIPLKTFTIQEGSYVDFTGNPMNPTLHITATERTKSSITSEAGVKRTVYFNCGVVVTKTLENMGLEFIISCPEDISVTNQLQAMGKEERGKVAVAMLTTGMFLSGNNAGAFSMNSALNDFLQSQITSITGNALKTLDLSVGMDNKTNALGATRTDYSFKFSKRFLNNRLNVVVGGSVSSGSGNLEKANNTFLDNVTLEYRLSPISNKYLKVFYNKDTYDWLEGYVGEYGGGFMWRRKLEHFKELFRFNTEGESPRRLKLDSVKQVK